MFKLGQHTVGNVDIIEENNNNNNCKPASNNNHNKDFDFDEEEIKMFEELASEATARVRDFDE